MNINFPPVDESYLKRKVEEGYHFNITEAVRDAVRKQREQEERANQRLRELLQPAIDQIARGETVPYTPELMEEIWQEALKDVREGKPVKFKEEVIPPSWRKGNPAVE